MYVSGNVGRNRKWNGIEQKISLSDFIARYEKHFLTEDTYAEVETGGEAGRLLAAGSTGEIAVIQMIDGDNRSAIFVPADDSMFGTGRESVRVPIMEDCTEYDSRFAMSAAQAWRTLLHMITDEHYPDKQSWFYL